MYKGMTVSDLIISRMQFFIFSIFDYFFNHWNELVDNNEWKYQLAALSKFQDIPLKHGLIK